MTQAARAHAKTSTQEARASGKKSTANSRAAAKLRGVFAEIDVMTVLKKGGFRAIRKARGG